MIDTRHELLIALAEAAELEHNLACLYLFSAFSIRSSESQDGISAAEVALFQGWKQSILRVAQEEMGHLAIVSNLLVAIGGSPHFTRPNFPQPANYYPPNIDFSLEPLGPTSLDRFIEFERPEEMMAEIAAVAPEPLEYERVGDFYRQIRGAFLAIPEEVLFLNTASEQDETPWSLAVNVKSVRSREQALEALDEIIVEGEGGAGGGQGTSHYERFRDIRTQFSSFSASNPRVQPARPVLSNPQTRPPRDAPTGNLITADSSREVAELFDVLYSLMLRVLEQHFAFAGETPLQTRVLRLLATRLMRHVIRPLGEDLTLLPAHDDGRSDVAGACFQSYGTETLTRNPPIVWAIFRERLVFYAAECDRLSNEVAPGLRLPEIAATLRDLAHQIELYGPN